MTEITAEILREFLTYDPETGALTWKVRDVKWFEGSDKRSPKGAANIWNARFAGKPAFTADHSDGYRRGQVLGKTLSAHRVAWTIHYGQWPSLQIDHINGNADDNRIANLRVVTSKDNSKNLAKPSSNTSGHVGVCWNKQAQKWVAQIQVNRRNIYLGLFPDIKEAVAARNLAERKYGFHQNHGR